MSGFGEQGGCVGPLVAGRLGPHDGCAVDWRGSGRGVCPLWVAVGRCVGP